MPRKRLSVDEITGTLNEMEMAWATEYLSTKATGSLKTDCPNDQMRAQIRAILEQGGDLTRKFRNALSMQRWRTKGEGRTQKHFTLESAEAYQLSLLAEHEGVSETEVIRRLITQQFEKNSELQYRLGKQNSVIRKFRQRLKAEEAQRSELERITKEYATLLGLVWSISATKNIDWASISPAQLIGGTTYALGFLSMEEDRMLRLKKSTKLKLAKLAKLEAKVERPQAKAQQDTNGS